MFTGIIEATGTIQDIRIAGTNKTFVISSLISGELKIDQSVAHEGVCLTVEACSANDHEVTMIHETLVKTNLGSKRVGDIVNLERCMQMNGRLDGHIVQGHVDQTTRCIEKKELDGSWLFRFELPDAHKALIVPQGSICINGISLTVSHLDASSFGVSIIPYTYEHTTISAVDVGLMVNVEFDILGKYVERHLALR